MNFKPLDSATPALDAHRLRSPWRAAAAVSVIAALLATACAPGSPKGDARPLATPETPTEPVIEYYFGTRVEDPYRWMEDRDAPRFEQWLRNQDNYAREILDALPGREQLQQRLLTFTGGGSVARNVRVAGNREFLVRRDPRVHGALLVMRSTDDDATKKTTLVDASTFGEGATIDYYQPSPDGRRVVYGISSGGSEASMLRILDIETGHHSTETIDRTDYAEPAWLADSSGFYYNRLNEHIDGAPASDRYLSSRVYLHLVGTDPETDKAVFGRGVTGSPELEAIDSPYIETTPGSDVLLGLVYRGADAAMGVYVGQHGADVVPVRWRKLAEPADGVTGIEVHDNDLYLLTRADAPRYQVSTLDAKNPDLATAHVVIPETDRVIQAIGAASDALYIAEMDAGLGRMRRYDFETRAITEVALPLLGTVRGPVTDPNRAGALIGLQDWLAPEAWYRLQENGRTEPANLVEPWTTNNAIYAAEELKVPSWDGTLIPLSIIRNPNSPKPGPLWLMAYGAYGVSATPAYTGVYGTSRLMPLLEDGGSYAVCHVRGGGELGDEWHRAGMLENKPNSHRDLIACAKYLVEKGYTRPSLLALEGASAGGLVAGMATVERPDLFRVVFNRVGDTNPLRMEHAADGPLMITEFGSTATEAGFRALLEVDPTQHTRAGTAYPAVMFTAGFNDPRVAPWQPGKLAAHMQAANGGHRPIILRTDFQGGHVAAAQTQIAREHAEMLSFFYSQMEKTGSASNRE